MMFPSFGCNTVYTFRILKPLKKVFRQNPVEAAVRRPAVGRPSAGRHGQMTATKICFSEREIAEIMNCGALKRGNTMC